MHAYFSAPPGPSVALQMRHPAAPAERPAPAGKRPSGPGFLEQTRFQGAGVHPSFLPWARRGAVALPQGCWKGGPASTKPRAGTGLAFLCLLNLVLIRGKGELLHSAESPETEGAFGRPVLALLLPCPWGLEQPRAGVTRGLHAERTCLLRWLFSPRPPSVPSCPTEFSGFALCFRDFARLRKMEFYQNSSAFCWKYPVRNIFNRNLNNT